jgi:hypothetical protein
MRDLAEILEVSKGIAEQAVAKLREEGLMCGHAQLARCLLKGLSLQEPTEIIQLIKYLPALFNLSRFPKGCVPLFPKYRDKQDNHTDKSNKPIHLESNCIIC